MRILEYRVRMTGGHYYLTNNPRDKDAEGYGRPTGPGIHLIIEQCTDLEDFVEKFDFVDREDEEKYGLIKREVLLGENKDWILITVGVRNSTIFLTYGNPEYARQSYARSERIHRGETVDDVWPPSEYLILEMIGYPNGGARLRFVTPRNDGSGYADTTLVQIPSSPKEYLVVTEFDGHKRRELTFLDVFPSNFDEYLLVKEFM